MRKGFTKLPVFRFHGIFEIPWRLSAIFKNQITRGKEMKKHRLTILLGLIPIHTSDKWPNFPDECLQYWMDERMQE